MSPSPSPDLSQGQDAYQRLVNALRLGELSPGDRLTETELAAQYGISRTPVREAIRQLETEGLVVHTPRIGTTIRRLDPSEISELYEMRAVLEGTAARFAARAASAAELAEIAAIQDQMATTPQGPDLYRQNQQFHAAILDASRNRFLMRAVDAVQKTLLILGRSTLATPDRSAQALDEHDQIVAALCAHDPDTAEAAMRRHIDAAHAARLRQLRPLRPYEPANDDL